MNWIYKAEKKFEKFAVSNLMRYVVGIKILGVMLGLISPTLYVSYLAFDVNAVLNGQVWRLVTFVLRPEVSQGNQMFVDILFFAIWAYVYYFIGNSIERIWGTFRFNLYFFMGFAATIVFSFFYYLIINNLGVAINDAVMGYYYMHIDFIFQSMFLTFALMFPETNFLVYFVIPVKAKWLGYLGVAFSIYEVFRFASGGIYAAIILFLAAYGNFLYFYLLTNNPMKRARFFKQPSQKRKIKYRNTAFKSTGDTTEQNAAARHKCAVCGRTEMDDERLTFRFCSKCDGNYEYCSDHLFIHEHVTKK